MTGPELTEEERDTALTSVAIVRLALQDLDLPEKVQRLTVLLDGRDGKATAELIFRIADLTATILEAWHTSMLLAVPEQFHSEINSPEGLLDDLVRMLVQGPPTEES